MFYLNSPLILPFPPSLFPFRSMTFLPICFLLPPLSLFFSMRLVPNDVPADALLSQLSQ